MVTRGPGAEAGIVLPGDLPVKAEAQPAAGSNDSGDYANELACGGYGTSCDGIAATCGGYGTSVDVIAATCGGYGTSCDATAATCGGYGTSSDAIQAACGGYGTSCDGTAVVCGGYGTSCDAERREAVPSMTSAAITTGNTCVNLALMSLSLLESTRDSFSCAHDRSRRSQESPMVFNARPTKQGRRFT